VMLAPAAREGVQDICAGEDRRRRGYSPKLPASRSSTCSEISLRLLSPIPTNAGSWHTR
jgi:hypothetical protein